MIITAEFESHEAVPPVVWAQCRKAIVQIMNSYGLNPTIREDRSAELEAYQRFWADQAARRDDFPKMLAEAEVK